jgi:hypothetical protein
MKIITYGFFLNPNAYLRDDWSKVDFAILSAALIDMFDDSTNLPIIKVFRLVRAMRPLRFLSHNKNMKIIVIVLF